MSRDVEKTNLAVRGGVALLCAVVLAVSALAIVPARATVNIADVPLFLKAGVDPNVLFVLDDSGSMMWEVLPDELIFQFGGGVCDWVKWVYPRINNIHGGGDYCGTPRTVRFHEGLLAAQMRSFRVNALYYNPAVTYQPWVNEDGEPMDAADPAAAPNRPLFPGYGNRDLTTEQSWTGRWWNTNGNTSNTTLTYYPATYYYLPEGDDPSDASNFVEVQIRSSTPSYSGHGREQRTDCTGGVCTYDQEIQNFANWYTYHRNRVFTSRAGIGRAFSRFDGGLRVGYGTINHGRTSVQTVDGESGRTVVRGVREFTGEAKTNFFEELYERPIPTEGTPLRRALEGAGEYFRRDDDRGPWSSTPGDAGGGDHLECRQSYTILMTDGYTTGTNLNSGYGAAGESRRTNTDGTTSHNTENVHPDPAVDNYVYEPAPPYSDEWSHNLADVAMYYWKRDLRPDLANRVPTGPRNEAFWQHMVTYGVALGVQGSIDPDDAWAAVEAGTAIDWPDPRWSYSNCGSDPTGQACPARIDDLLHAGINSRGGFFSVMDAEAFAQELSAVLDDIVARTEASATSAAANTAVLQGDALVYHAGFRSDDWTGQLRAYNVSSSGVAGTVKWDAEVELRSNAARNLVTSFAEAAGTNEASGVELDYDDLSAIQQAALDTALSGSEDGLGADRVDWLSGEDVSGLRSRTPVSGADAGQARLLGDIVHSSPRFWGRPNMGYAYLDGTEGSSYSTFRNLAAYKSRPDVLYVGANDGMLHAFDATSGEELFAYMPSELLLPATAEGAARINSLMDPEYDHRYFLDGNVAVGDVYMNGQWRTVLVGTMGAGGRTVFALDVTNPEDFGPASVLWEFQHSELGYGVTDPAIVRLASGQWAAVFGNGYNSDSLEAQLFVVPFGNPAEPIVFGTGEGGSGYSNGLAAPTVTDWPNADFNAAYVYAGDLQGHLWRFDLTGSPGQGGGQGQGSGQGQGGGQSQGQAELLFRAVDSANGDPQPITSRPRVAPHPTKPGHLMILFGTGSYFRVVDGNLDNPQIQSLYGLVDDGEQSGISRSALLRQEILADLTYNFGGVSHLVRIVSDNTLSDNDPGWYMDLSVNGVASGERVISPPSFPLGQIGERVRFSTLIPDDDPCGFGRGGFVMDIDLASGARKAYSVFDLDQDGNFDEGDMVDAEGIDALAGLEGLVTVSGYGGGGGQAITTIMLISGDQELIIINQPPQQPPSHGDPGEPGDDPSDPSEPSDPTDPDDPGGDDDEYCVGAGCDMRGLIDDPVGRRSWRQLR